MTNGHGMPITLAAVDLPDTADSLDLSNGEQKHADLRAPGPTGRTPAIAEREAGHLMVSESGTVPTDIEEARL